MKKILGLTLATLLVMTFVSGGTWAYFNDTESSSNNSLTAGTLDLNIEGGDSAVTTFSVDSAVPGDSGSGSDTLANVGDLNGELDIEFSAITNTGGSGGGEFEDGIGNLGAVAEIAAFIDVDQSGTWNSGDIGLKSDGTTYNDSVALDYDAIDDYDSQTWDAIETLAASSTDDFIIMWRIPAGAGNDIQGDSVSFDIAFIMEQGDAD
jgi:spore coat-associated protein N